MRQILLAAALALGLPFAAQAATFTLDFGANSISSNTPATGASASIDWTFADSAGDILVTLNITNTTGQTIFGSGATSSVLTAFGFDLLSGYSYIVGSFVGGTYLDTLILGADAQPFDTLDFAAADNSNYNGGNANGALPEPFSDTVSFKLDSTQNAAQAFAAFLAGFNQNGLDAAVRFQQVTGPNDYNGAESDKLLYVPPVPLPAAGWMLIAGLGGLAVAGRRRAT